MKSKPILTFLKSFKYAYCGIVYCIKNERNFRFDLVVLMIVLIHKHFYNLSTCENILLMITFALVLSAEAFNTAIETTINLISPQYNRLARIAKDVASAAVLIKAVFAFVIGLYLFWDISVFKKIINYYADNIIFAICIVILLILSYLFVFKIFPNNSKNKFKDVNNDN